MLNFEKTNAQKEAEDAYNTFLKNRSNNIYKPENKEQSWLDKIKKLLGIVR